MLTCKDNAKLLSEAFERKLNLRERFAVRFHSWMCTACRRCAEQLEFLHSATPGSVERSHGEEIRLSDSARDRIRARLTRD